MDIGTLTAAHMNKRDRAIFTQDELEASAAANAERIERFKSAVSRLHHLVARRHARPAPLASQVPAE